MAKDIVGRSLLTVSKTDEDQRGQHMEIRVVQWIIDGEAKTVKLEKRQFYKDDDGAEMTGKADGFTLKDLAAVRDNWSKIVATIKNPPPIPATAASAGADNPPEEAPF